MSAGERPASTDEDGNSLEVYSRDDQNKLKKILSLEKNILNSDWMLKPLFCIITSQKTH